MWKQSDDQDQVREASIFTSVSKKVIVTKYTYGKLSIHAFSFSFVYVYGDEIRSITL